MKKEITRAEIVDMIEKSVGKRPSESVREAEKMALREMLSEQTNKRKAVETNVAGGVAIALAATKGSHTDAAKYAESRWGSESKIAKALQASTDTAGGFTVREEYSTDWIDMLNATTVMRKMGCTILPLVNGQLKIPKMTAAASAAYLTEGAVIAASQETFGQVLLQGKKLGAKVPISNDLLKFSMLPVDTIVRNDIVTRMALREDLAFLEGTGVDATPVGIRNLMLAGNAIAMTATPTAVTATTDAGRMVTLLDNANVPNTRRGWIMRPSVKNWLATVREATGALAFPEVQANNMWWGYPIATSTQITIDVAGPPTQSYVYLCEFPEIMIGDSYTLEINASAEAAYTDSTSTLVSAFDRDETVIRAISMHDIGVKHDAAIAALTGCTWGGG